MTGDFEPDLNWSHSVAGLPFWLDVYKRAFPGFVAAHIPTGDGWHQRAGRDRIVVLDDSTTVTIDEKGRRDQWPDILVEVLADRDRRVPGWGNPDKRLGCDYIGYAFVSTQTCHLIPYRELRRVMKNGAGADWWRESQRKQQEGRKDGVHFVDARNPRDTSKPVRYWTRNIAVPTKLLLSEITKSLTLTWEPDLEAVEIARPPDPPLSRDDKWPEPAKPGEGIEHLRGARWTG